MIYDGCEFYRYAPLKSKVMVCFLESYVYDVLQFVWTTLLQGTRERMQIMGKPKVVRTTSLPIYRRGLNATLF